MNWTMLLGALFTAGGISALLWLLADPATAERRTVRAKLRKGFSNEPGDRPVRPSDKQGLGARLLTHPGWLAYLDALVSRAGRPPAWPVSKVVSTKMLGTLIGLGLGFLFWLRGPSLAMTGLVFVIGAVGFFLPDLLLLNTGIKRRQAILLELPDTLDQMSIAVDAGLGFDMAMMRVARNGKGVLAQELVRTLQDLQVGQARRQAYTGLADRCGVPELRRFIRAILQAEEYGIQLADVLSTQAKEMRTQRRQVAERKAYELPVKITFPLILFILPVLMIVILGPAVISIMQAFSH